MSGLGIRLYTDEDVDPDVAIQLRRRGYDAQSCHEAGNAGRRRSDEWQLSFATGHGRAIVTHNVADFVRLDGAWKATGRGHWGIIATSQDLGIGETVRRLQGHLDTTLPDEQRDVLRYLARLS